MSTGFTGPRKNILCKSELELLNELVEENAYSFFKYCHEFSFKFGEFECHISEIRFMEWFSKLVSILENFELKKLENSKELLHKIIYKNVFLQDKWNTKIVFIYISKKSF